MSKQRVSQLEGVLRSRDKDMDALQRLVDAAKVNATCRVCRVERFMPRGTRMRQRQGDQCSAGARGCSQRENDL